MQNLLYEQALNTYKAIYGHIPEHKPYKDASHTPFRGIDPELVKELIDEREVTKFLREWKKENTPKEISTFCFVDKTYFITQIKDNFTRIQCLETGVLKIKKTDTLKPVIPLPGQADLLKSAVTTTYSDLINLYTKDVMVRHTDVPNSRGHILRPFAAEKTNPNGIAMGFIYWADSSQYLSSIVPISKVILI
jgi:hypothetical protein